MMQLMMQAVGTTLVSDYKVIVSFAGQRFNNMSLIRQLAPSTNSTHSTHSKYGFNLDVYQKNDDGRLAAEQFIKEGFASTYGADIDIDISMPYLLVINNGNFKAALGIRSATEKLFIEQYLTQPIEHYVSQHQATVARELIAEIGHLYSNSNKFTIPLFLTTAVSLFCKGYEHMAFAGTDHVVKLIGKAGIECHHIAPADKNKLLGASQKWGSYYEKKPQVVFVSLACVMKLVNKSPHFKQMFEQLVPKIALTTSKLKR
ncbi:MAG: hypothetical protein ACI8XG_001822 [Congregibacter sp.]|jgi:hypothetical protein